MMFRRDAKDMSTKMKWGRLLLDMEMTLASETDAFLELRDCGFCQNVSEVFWRLFCDATPAAQLAIMHLTIQNILRGTLKTCSRR